MSIGRRDFLKGTVAAVAVGPSVLAPSQGFTFVEGVAGSAGSAILGEVPPKYPFKWWVSLDGGEVFQEPFDTRKEAIKSADEHGGALIAECQQQDFNLSVDGGSLLEMLYGQNEEFMGEDGEFIDATDGQLRELGDVVTKALEEWVVRNKIDTKAFIFGEVRNKELVGGPEVKRLVELVNSPRNILDPLGYGWKRPDKVLKGSGAGWLALTKDKSPKLFECFEAISHDNGFGAGHDSYALPGLLKDKLPEIEQGLTTLTADELSEFAIGDQEVANKIAQRSSELAAAHIVLNGFNNDWDLDFEP